MSYCKHCGAKMEEGDQFCSQCGRKQDSPVQQSTYYDSSAKIYQEVPDHLASAILVTIFCCLPLGIPAIVYAAMANSAKAAGNYDQALENAESANTWVKVSFGLGIAIIILYLLMAVSSF